MADRSGRSSDAWSQEFARGWAGDLVWSGGIPWLAWTACLDPEPELLSYTRQEWPLRPGRTLADWRQHSASVVFTLSLARLDAAGVGKTRELARSRHALAGPALAALPGHATPAVVWSERRAAGCVLLAALDGEPGEVVYEATGAVLGPRAAVDSAGRLWVVWQQWPEAGATEDARPRIMAAGRPASVPPGANNGWASPLTLSSGGQSSWSPALVADPDGGLWCAWAAWTGEAYHIFVCYAPPGDAWGQPLQVSPAHPRYFHLAPAIAAMVGRAWVVWSRTPRWGQINHRFNHTRSLHAALATAHDDGSLTIEPAPGQPVLGEPGRLPVHSIPFLHSAEEEFITPQAPRVRLAGNAPVVFYRQFRGAGFKDFGWALWAVRHTGEDWTTPERLSTQTGFPDSPYGVIPVEEDGTSWLLAYHAGEYAHDPTQHPSHPVESHRLLVEQANLAERDPAVRDGHPLATVPEGAVYRRLARAARQEPDRDLTVNGRSYTLLYGDLHRHSAYSKCMAANDGDPLNHWQWVQDVAGLDFYALTEHLEYLSYVEWRRIEDLAGALAASGRVLALYGFELAIPPGHTNFFYADQAVGHDLRVACLSSPDLAAVWPKLAAWLPPGKVVAIRHHQGHRGDDLARTYGPQYEPVAEIIQTRGEYPQWLQSLWRQGMRLGVVGASDHSRGAPFVQGLTGLWLPQGERSREAVLAGLRARRTFATNGLRMSVFLSATGAGGGSVVHMGESGRVTGAPRLLVEASGTRWLETIEFYRDDQLLHVETLASTAARLAHTDQAAPNGEHAYWVRVTQQPERNGVRPHRGVAYSSPVWLTAA